MAVNGNVKEVKQPAGKTNAIVKFFREIKAELKRMTWPTKKDVKKAIAAVVTFCVIYIVLVGVFDYGFNNLFSKWIFK
jgi:preprotein translocase subunit SecE